MQGLSANTNTKVRAAIAGLFLSAAFFFVFYSAGLNTTVFSQARRSTRRADRAAPKKYSSFPHDVIAHRIECTSCHKFPSSNWDKVRSGDAAFPDITDYPKHESCLGCHRQQFFRGTPPVVCTICHTNPGPRDSSRHPFPNPRELFDQSAKGATAVSDFSVFFPHDKHIEIVTAKSGRRTDEFRVVSWRRSRSPAEESCSVCHQTYKPQGDSSDEYVTKPPEKWGDAFWLKKGTFKTTPIGHTVCFTCHSTDSGIEPSPTNCGTCHKLKSPATPTDFDPKLAALTGTTDKIMLTAWRNRDTSATFRHEWFSHAELSCATCHNVMALNTLDTKTKKVPIASCATCHATATSDEGGALNYEIESRRANSTFQCVKCHVAYGKSAIPDSHLKALAAATGK